MLRASDLSHILKVGQTASGCDDVDQLRKEVLNLVPEAFHVERANFFLAHSYPSPRIDLRNIASRGMDPKYLALFRDYYYKLDPIFKAIHLSRTVVPFQDVMSDEELSRSEWYHGFVKPQSFRDAVAINLRASNRLLGVLVLARSGDECSFSSREKVKAELIAPYLAGAIEKANFLEKARNTEKIISAIFRDLPYTGIVVLDESCAQIYANVEARKTLARTVDGQESSENPFDPLPRDLRIQCQKLFQNPHTTEHVKNQKVDLIVKGEKQSVPVSVSLIHDSKNSRLCLICIGRSERTSMFLGQPKKLGLTCRESEIIGLVCQGLKNSEIGQRLFISEATVENHLHSIFEKTGVKNRAGLVHKVMLQSNDR